MDQSSLMPPGPSSSSRGMPSSYEELVVAAKLKPVHARLIVSNLDSQSTAAAATPQRSVSGVDDEVLSSRTALLGGGTPEEECTQQDFDAVAAATGFVQEPLFSAEGGKEVASPGGWSPCGCGGGCGTALAASTG